MLYLPLNTLWVTVVPVAAAIRPVPLWPRVFRGCIRLGLQKVLAPHPLTSEFVGMASYAPFCFLDIMDDDVGSDGSSIGDVAPSHHPS